MAAVCRMEGDAARLLHELKYSGWTGLAQPLGECLVDPARYLIRRAGVSARELLLAPVPIAAARRRERGFNQAALLAQALGRSLNADVLRLLERCGAPRSQVHLPRGDRAANVAGQFRARRNEGRPRGPVLLVDDVVTTGATASACTDALAADGWSPIGVVSFARAWQTLEPSGYSRIRL